MDHCGTTAVHPIHKCAGAPQTEPLDHWQIAARGSSDREGCPIGGG